MSRYTCPDCGESVDDKAAPHGDHCEGSREDLLARVAELEAKLRWAIKVYPRPATANPIPILDVSEDGARLRILQQDEDGMRNIVDLDLEWFVRELTVMNIVAGRGSLPALLATGIVPSIPYGEWARAFLWRVMGIRPPTAFVGELARQLAFVAATGRPR